MSIVGIEYLNSIKYTCFIVSGVFFINQCIHVRICHRLPTSARSFIWNNNCKLQPFIDLDSLDV